MPIFSITHLTDYRYQWIVAFGEASDHLAMTVAVKVNLVD